jgi:hypothetical protein
MSAVTSHLAKFDAWSLPTPPARCLYFAVYAAATHSQSLGNRFG